MKRLLIGLLAVGCLLVITGGMVGCRAYGPTTIGPDRFDYNESIAQSWNTQLLQNLVRMRYGGTPHFVEVNSILQQYQLEISSFGGFIANGDGVSGLWEVPFQLEGMFREAPTITYSPLVGEEFTERLLKPIDPITLIYISQSGWPVDHLFEMCVDQVNGIKNRAITGTTKNQASESGLDEFHELLIMLKAMQERGMLDIRVEQEGSTVVLFVPPAGMSDDEKDLAKRAKQLLGLSQTATKFTLVTSPVQRNGMELAVQTKSILTILMGLSRTVMASQEDIEKGYVVEEMLMSMSEEVEDHLLAIYSTNSDPQEAFVKIWFRERYYYISDDDKESKRTFALLTYLFNLQSRDTGLMAPLLTLPAG
ncbi:hypothetical protein KS4_00710 [Poriferisphaera corsica]|uniref:Uncharacterized protein n=1 Tax=Poriferisphaera corsica TaxID=2528020 RepID=A0A517YP96_9BACT|nr:hypothetical protein [Poriferisphaera corsica]QDU32043.1 hypothetical protein KS4_00710 [Poriferisphaera corsica]